MSKIITVIGATGIQGGSVIRALLNAPNSSYTIRATTRNPSSDAAKALASQGVKVVKADLHDVDSLIAAFTGTHAIFAVTNFFENLASIGIEKSMESETEQGINLAKAASMTETLDHYIWSTLPDSKANTGGKFFVPYFESKNAVDRYIRSDLPDLAAKTTFAWFGWYASNILNPVFRPSRIHTADGSESYITLLNIPPETKFPLLGEANVNVGLYAMAILEQAEKTLPRKFVSGVVECRGVGDVVASFAAAKGIQVRAVQISREDYRALWPGMGELMDITHYYLEVTGERAFSDVDEEVLTGDDLGVQGLVSVDEAFKRLPS
ncbi:uncharacterized protein BDV17DRAFT_269007 [Aspergillus undulatus]|uniref:uncharacterized protein n=1 Tax=Aspergillus undulatus TaxID=1810928 RepID=UPI003CCD6551